ncbi:hypothetical protein HKX48_007562 [Thoreauomyces humboldtii]|nr:hypothetical protein HKX48_007562 [Thoreauomyces humboldtii]
MPVISIKTNLPERVIRELRKSGAHARTGCEIHVIEALEKPLWDVYSAFLQTFDEVDPVLGPNFGHPLAPYLLPQAQMEVYQLLTTYQLLSANQLAASAPLPQLPPLVFPKAGQVQYRQPQIAIQKVIEQIEKPDPSFDLPNLAAVPSGQVLCDLNITYGNCVVVRRIRKI